MTARVRFVDAAGEIVVDRPCRARTTSSYIGEATLPYSYLKAPYFKPLGYPDGIYRVGPLARLNVATHCGTPRRTSSSPNTISVSARWCKARSTSTTRG